MSTIYKDLPAPHAKDAALSVIADMGVAGGILADFDVRLSENGGAMTPVVFSITELGDFQYKFDVAGSVMDTAGLACLLVSGATRQTVVNMTVEANAKTTGELYSDLNDATVKVGIDVLDTDVITAASIKADAVTKVSTGVWGFSVRTLTSLGSTAIAGIWDFATASVTAGMGLLLKTNIDAKASDIEADTVAIQLQTDKMAFDGSGYIESTPQTAIAISSADMATLVDLVFDESLAGHLTAGTAGKALQLSRGAAIGKWKVVNILANSFQIEMYDYDNTTLLGTLTVDTDVDGKPTQRST